MPRLRRALPVAVLLFGGPACAVAFGVDFDDAFPRPRVVNDGAPPDQGARPPDDPPCPAGRKPCGGTCVSMDVAHGCGSASCAPCSVDGGKPPLRGVSECTAGVCDFRCEARTVKDRGAGCFDVAFDEARLSAGGTHACAVKRDGPLACWGDPADGKTTPPGGSFIEVSAAGAQTCALKADGAVACWGFDVKNPLPTDRFRHVSAGGHGGATFVCGLKMDDSVVCWGSTMDPEGVLLSPTGSFLQISVGGFHACGLRADSSIACWGARSRNQGNVPAGAFRGVTAGYEHTCGLRTNGSVACWGDNSSGQSAQTPGEYRQISAGIAHTCGVKQDGTVYCWGAPQVGQTAGSFLQVSSGDTYGCGVRTTGLLQCWGDPSYGRTLSPDGLFSSGP